MNKEIKPYYDKAKAMLKTSGYTEKQAYKLSFRLIHIDKGLTLTKRQYLLDLMLLEWFLTFYFCAIPGEYTKPVFEYN